jgi:hypothetical protein
MSRAVSDAEKVALAALLKATIAADRFPLSPRLRALKRILDKLEPPRPAVKPLPPPKPSGERSTVLSKKRRRKIAIDP